MACTHEMNWHSNDIGMGACGQIHHTSNKVQSTCTQCKLRWKSRMTWFELQRRNCQNRWIFKREHCMSFQFETIRFNVCLSNERTIYSRIHNGDERLCCVGLHKPTSSMCVTVAHQCLPTTGKKNIYLLWAESSRVHRKFFCVHFAMHAHTHARTAFTSITVYLRNMFVWARATVGVLVLLSVGLVGSMHVFVNTNDHVHFRALPQLWYGIHVLSIISSYAKHTT